jgi:threonyl-tRNA synthetase
MGSSKKSNGSGSGSGGKKDDFHVFATRKWAVLDAPGVAQPDWNNKSEAAEDTTSASSAAQKGSASNKEGLQGRRATKSSGGPKIAADGDKGIGGDSFVERQANPAWLQHRVQVYDEIAALRQSELAHKQPAPITVALPDGKVLASDPKTNEPFAAWKTTPYDVAASISSGLADASTVAKVTYRSFVSDYRLDEDGMVGADTLMSLVNDDPDGNDDNNTSTSNSGEAKGQTFLWDMTRPLVGNVSKIEFLKFEESQDAKTVFWHSSAHMMGEALERLYGCKLTIGPPLAGGFYYDSYMNADTLKEDDCTWRGDHLVLVSISWLLDSHPCLSTLADAPVEAEVSKIIKQKQKFERLVITKEEGLRLFADNPFKVRILSTKVPEGGRTTVYRCGDLIDLCRGPHVPHTGKVKAFAATRHSATNWLGDTTNDSLQRLYGISFPDKKMLKVWKENQEKVSGRMHDVVQVRVIFHTSSRREDTLIGLHGKERCVRILLDETRTYFR